MQRYVLSLVFICVLAIEAIVLLRPDPAVKFEAELARLEPEEALERLTATERRIELTQNLKLMQARLALAAGDLSSARVAFQSVLDRGDGTPQVLDELAELAALEGNLAEAAALTAEAEALSPDSDRRQRLGYWYRLLGDRPRETALLESVPLRRLTDFERRRIADLYLAAGDVDGYREMLILLSEAPGEDRLLARRLLLELEIESGEPATAIQLALDWNAKAPKDRDNLQTSLRTLVGRGSMPEAAVLARNAISVEPDIGSVPVDVFVSTGNGGLGREMQALWLANDRKIDEADWQALALTAARSGDLAGLRATLNRDAQEDAAPPPEVFLQFLRYQGPRALVPFGPKMTEETFEEMPLLGAAWSSWQRRVPQTYEFLLAATEGPLTDWDRAIWMSIAQDLRGTPYYRELLAGAFNDAGIVSLLRSSVRAPVPTTSLPE